MILESTELAKCPIYLTFLFGDLNFDLNHFLAMIADAVSLLFLETQFLY